MARTRAIPSVEEEIEKVEAIEEEKVQEATPVPSLPKWQFMGGGTLILRDGQSVESNAVFRADSSAIPPAFMDLMRLLEPGEIKPKYSDEDILDIEMVKRADGKYDIMAGDVVLNEVPLSKSGAKAFMITLTAE